MNDNTRRQWERRVEDHPELSASACWVLYWFVHDHSALEQCSRPGWARLLTVTRLSRNGVRSTLRELITGGHIVLAKQFPKGARKADHYAIPWLNNPPPVVVSSETTTETTRETTTETTSSSPYGEDVRRRRSPRTSTASHTGSPLRGRVDANEQFHPGMCGCLDCRPATAASSSR